MGIKGLYSYINQTYAPGLDTVKLDDTKLIIDGSSISYNLLDRSKNNSRYASGGIYKNFSEFVVNFFNKFIDHKVDILVILGGTGEPRHQNTILRELETYIENATNDSKFQFRPTTANCKDDLFYATFIEDIFLDVLKKLKIKFLVCTFHAPEVISTVAKILNCPVLTANSELFLYGNYCIFFDSLEFHEEGYGQNYEMICKIFRPEKFIQNFPGLKVSCLPILLLLLGQNYFEEDNLFKFFRHEFHPYFTKIQGYIPHVKIEEVLKWLRNHTLHSAAEEIIPLMMSTGKSLESSKKIIEDTINIFSTMSTYMLRYFVDFPSFKIDEAEISKMQSKFSTFKFDNKNEASDNNSDEQDNNVLERKLNKSITNLFIDDHSKGKLSSSAISLIEHETYIPWYQVEHLEYPSVYEMSIPLISFIYSLLLSCTDEENVNPLKLFIRERLKIKSKEIIVKKYPLRLQDIKNSDTKTKLEIINDVLLGVNEANCLQGLPENWRLFAATIVFWMKQKVEPEKDETHLYTLLLAMFFTISNKKIKGMEDDNFFDKNFVEEVERLSEEKTEPKSEKLLQLTKAIEEISNDDAEITKRFWFPPTDDIMPEWFGKKFNKLNAQPKLSLHTVHIFMQFQCCLEQSRTINALLGFPYHQPLISEVFNGKLIKNLFILISRQSTNSNCKDFIFGNMHATVLEAFKLLIENVNSLSQ